jgi:hypothetical protein
MCTDRKSKIQLMLSEEATTLKLYPVNFHDDKRKQCPSSKTAQCILGVVAAAGGRRGCTHGCSIITEQTAAGKTVEVRGVKKKAGPSAHVCMMMRSIRRPQV